MSDNLSTFGYQRPLTLSLIAILACALTGCPGPDGDQSPTITIPKATWISQQAQLSKANSRIETLLQEKETLQKENEILRPENKTLQPENRLLRQENTTLLQLKTAVEGASIMSDKAWQCSYTERICYWIGLLIAGGLAIRAHVGWRTTKRLNLATFSAEVMSISSSMENEPQSAT